MYGQTETGFWPNEFYLDCRRHGGGGCGLSADGGACVKVAPLVCLLGFLFMIYGVVKKPSDTNARD